MSASRPNHIQVLEANEKGDDFIIGDVHGNNGCLERVLAEIQAVTPPGTTINPHRLFIVGDLTDRGKDNVGVIRRIMQNNDDPARPKIYVTRGNHEEMGLKSIKRLDAAVSGNKAKKLRQKLQELRDNKNKMSALDYIAEEKKLKRKLKSMEKTEKLVQQLNDLRDKRSSTMTMDERVEYNKQRQAIKQKLKQRLKKVVGGHAKSKNGGKWLVSLYLNEIMNGRIRLENGKVYFNDDSRIRMVRDFFDLLPYVTHVKNGPEDANTGNKDRGAFNIVHADMPVSDEELQIRIMAGLGFNDDELLHATWAREVRDENKASVLTPLANRGRHEHSDIAYCGHSIVKHHSQLIRNSSNTVDIDIGSYESDFALLVNHSRHHAMLIPGASSNMSKIPSALQKLPALVMQHLHENALYNRQHKTAAYIASPNHADATRQETIVSADFLEKLSERINKMKNGKDIHKVIAVHADVNHIAYNELLKLLSRQISPAARKHLEHHFKFDNSILGKILRPLSLFRSNSSHTAETAERLKILAAGVKPELRTETAKPPVKPVT